MAELEHIGELTTDTENAREHNPGLTMIEQSELVQHEAVIERGLQTFVDVGLALLAIRDRKLYRQEFGTFEGYCRERWSITPRHGRRLIGAAEVVTNLGPMGPKLPSNERQARPLLHLDPVQQQGAWQQVVDTAPDGKVTAKYVQEVVDRIRGMDIAVDVGTDDLRRIQIRSNNEWYTPLIYLGAARSVMGGIDIDPASSPAANENVKAATFYTKEDDGLLREWPGRVWLNPPYGASGPEFVAELLRQFEVVTVTEAILLVNSNATETQWFAPLWDHVLCFVRGRINFISNVGESNGSTHGSVFVYLGQNQARFIEAFQRFGPIVQRIA